MANYHIENYQEAIEYSKKLLTLALETHDKETETKAYEALGDCYEKLQDYDDEVIRYYEMCLDISKEIPDKRKKLGWANQKLGSALIFSERYKEGLQYSTKALEIAVETDDEKCQAKAYCDLGIYYQKTEDFDKAVEYLNKSLTLSQKLNNKDGEGAAYGNLGDTYQSQCKYEEAIKCHNKQLEIAQEMGNTKREYNAYNGLGIVYKSQGEYSKALKCYEENLRICYKHAADKKAEAVLYGNLGKIYGLLGKEPEAVDFYQKSLSLAREIGSKEMEYKAYHTLGDMYYDLNQLTKSKEMLEKALDGYKAIGSKRGEGNIYGRLGSIYDSQGDYNKAMEFQKRCLQISEEKGDASSRMSAFLGIGGIHLNRKEFQQGIDYFEKGCKIAVDIKAKRQEAICYSKLAIAFKVWSNNCLILKNDEARQEQYLLNSKHIEFLKKSLRCYDLLFDNIQEYDEFKISIFGDEFVIIYRCLTQALLLRDEVTEALLVSERGRARALDDLLVTKYSNNQDTRNDPISYTEVEKMASRSCIIFYALDHEPITTFQFTWVVKPENLSVHMKIIDEATFTGIVKSEFGLKVREVQCENRLIHTEEYHEEKPNVVDAVSESMLLHTSIQQRCIAEEDLNDDDYTNPALPKKQKCIAEEDLNDDDYTNPPLPKKQRCIAEEDLNDDDYTNPPLPKKQRCIAEEDLNDDDYTNPPLPKKQRCIAEEDLNDDDYTNPLECLYKALISPVLHKLTKDEIVIIPDGPLFNVPFAALQDPDTRLFLSETKRIRLAPSLTSLKALQESPADFHCKTGALIIGNPQVGEVMFRGKKREITALPCAEQEAQMIGELLAVKPFIGPQATKEAIKQNLREGVAIIHFAAHGTMDGEIFLTPAPTTGSLPNEQDYILTMKDVQESDVRPQLVVLSCCHSGRGEVMAEGVVGMSRAFLAAGARAVVASLWAIADEATMVFMEKFYRHLKEGESASKSLQQAMKDMREIPRYKDPMFWAPFFLIGDDVTVNI